MNIRYELSSRVDADFLETLRQLAAAPNVRRVCEIGGGGYPAFSLDTVRELGLKYTILDISKTELDKAGEGYEKVVADITNLPEDFSAEFDLIFSMYCAEHLRDGAVFHRNVHRLLASNGLAIHLFPTLYSLPFVLNRLVPEWLSRPLLFLLQPHRKPSYGKFPAYYSWCFGPLNKQVERLESVGYRVEQYVSFFGHSGAVVNGSGYFDRIPLLRSFHEWFAKQLLRHPVPWLSTFAFVVLKRIDRPLLGACDAPDPTRAQSPRIGDHLPSPLS